MDLLGTERLTAGSRPTDLAGTHNAIRGCKQADINPPRIARFGSVPKSQTTGERRAILRGAQRYLRLHLADFDLALVDVAQAVGTSPRQLQRIFREESDEEFRCYLLRVRMQRARKLLTRKQNPLAVRAVCRRVGYRQPSGLRQAFLRYYGINPSEVQPPPPNYDEFWRNAEKRA